MNARLPVHSLLLASVIGIDRLLNSGAASSQAAASGFPPINIIKVSDNGYRIELAVAGFELADLSLETKEKVLTVSGERKGGLEEGSEYLARGIANRSFKREFQLADYVEVKGATLKNGILTVELAREIPESQRHRRIEIGVTEAVQPDVVAEKEAAVA